MSLKRSILNKLDEIAANSGLCKNCEMSERLHRPEMSQIKAEIRIRTTVKLNFHKNVGLK